MKTKTYNVTVRDSVLKKDLTGTIEAETAAEAGEMAREEFAVDLDTFPEDVEIVSITEIPAEYQDTSIGIVPFCGGYSEGLVMVNALNDIELQFHHNFMGCAGIGGRQCSFFIFRNLLTELLYLYIISIYR